MHARVSHHHLVFSASFTAPNGSADAFDVLGIPRTRQCNPLESNETARFSS